MRKLLDYLVILININLVNLSTSVCTQLFNKETSEPSLTKLKQRSSHTQCVTPLVDLSRLLKPSSLRGLCVCPHHRQLILPSDPDGQMRGNHSAARRSAFSGEKVSLCWFPRSLTSSLRGPLLAHFCSLSQTFSLLCSPITKHMDRQINLQLHLQPIIPVTFCSCNSHFSASQIISLTFLFLTAIKPPGVTDRVFVSHLACSLSWPALPRRPLAHGLLCQLADHLQLSASLSLAPEGHGYLFIHCK